MTKLFRLLWSRGHSSDALRPIKQLYKSLPSARWPLNLIKVTISVDRQDFWWTALLNGVTSFNIDRGPDSILVAAYPLEEWAPLTFFPSVWEKAHISTVVQYEGFTALHLMSALQGASDSSEIQLLANSILNRPSAYNGFTSDSTVPISSQFTEVYVRCLD